MMQAIEAFNEKWLEAAFYLVFTATLRLREILALTWDYIEISEEAIEKDSIRRREGKYGRKE